MLHYIILRCCSFYITMLHYIVSPYVYDVALEVFSCSWDRGRDGGTGIGVRLGSGGQRCGGRDFYFRSIPIRGAGFRSIL